MKKEEKAGMVVVLTGAKETAAEVKTETSKKSKATPKAEVKVEPEKPEVPSKAETTTETSKKPEAPPKAETTAEPPKKPRAAPKAETTAEPPKKPKATPKAETTTEPPAKPKAIPKTEVKAEPPKESAPPVPAPASGSASPLKQMKQEFNRRANMIRTEMGNIQNSFVIIGFQLHWIKTNNMYRVLNYKNICDYAEKEYNIKKSTCCNLINIIENYAERDENGEVIESITECYRNYSSSQLVAMIGMPEELQQRVTPEMSVREIQRLRKGGQEKPPVDSPKVTITNVKAPEHEKTSPAGKTAAPPVAAAKPAIITKPAVPTPAAVVKPVTAAKEKEAEKISAVTAGNMDMPTKKADASADGTVKLAEIDSYDAYKDMQGKLDTMMKHVFSGSDPVRVKIVCVQV